MLSAYYENVTTFLLVQNAISVILNKIGEEINAHAACIITDGNEVHLNHLPAVRGDCQTGDKNVFINQVQHGVAIGCSFFVVSESCAFTFLNEFHRIHDWVDQKYEKKVLAVIDTQRVLDYSNVTDILTHRIVINDIPLTLLLQPNSNNEWICVWSAYPYDTYFVGRNRFFLGNLSFEFDNQMIPELTDLNGLIVTGAFINYPPYSSYERVPIDTGNTELFGSNESRPIYLDGQEHIILLEFCIKYNCTLTARLDYDEELWGETFDNQTGVGLLGALTMRNANVSAAALYLWESPYKFTQYSTIIQRATATAIVPKPLPLPYWQTPILPFPDYIWSYVIGSFLFGALILFIVNTILMKINSPAGGQVSMGLFDSLFTVFKMSIFQGVPINIDYLSNITFFTAMLTFALIIGNLYCGGLSSVMTITRYESPIDGVETLVTSKVPWGGTSILWMDTLQQSDYPPHKTLIKNFIVKPIAEFRQIVRRRSIALTVEGLQHGTLSYQSFLEKDSSKYYMIMKEPLYYAFTVVYATKTWPFMEQLNRIVFMQQESGIRYYWEYLVNSVKANPDNLGVYLFADVIQFHSFSSCRYSSGVRLMDYDIQRNLEENGKPPQAGDPVKLSVEHILGALFLLLFGSALATVSFSLEMLFNYFRGKKWKVLNEMWWMKSEE